MLMKFHITLPERFRRRLRPETGGKTPCRHHRGRDAGLGHLNSPQRCAEAESATVPSRISLLPAWRNLWLP